MVFVKIEVIKWITDRLINSFIVSLCLCIPPYFSCQHNLKGYKSGSVLLFSAARDGILASSGNRVLSSVKNDLSNIGCVFS